MKHLDTDALYRYVNFQFPDDSNLALFNIIFEVMNGSLPYELIDGLAGVVEDPETDIDAALGLVTVGPKPYKFNVVFDPDHADQGLVLKGLVRSLKIEQKPKLLLELKRPPFIIATLVACEGKDGRFAYAIFRHPNLDEGQARAIIVNLFSAEEDGPATPTASN